MHNNRRWCSVGRHWSRHVVLNSRRWCAAYDAAGAGSMYSLKGVGAAYRHCRDHVLSNSSLVQHTNAAGAVCALQSSAGAAYGRCRRDVLSLKLAVLALVDSMQTHSPRVRTMEPARGSMFHAEPEFDEHFTQCSRLEGSRQNRLDGWIGRMDGWLVGWLVGWMDGWMNERDFHDPLGLSSSGASYVPSRPLNIPSPSKKPSREPAMPNDRRNAMDTSGNVFESLPA